MAEVVELRPMPAVSSHYREIRSFTERPSEDDFRVVLATEDERPGVVHVMLIGRDCVEVLDSYRDTEAGRSMAAIVGVAAEKAIFFSAFYGEDA